MRAVDGPDSWARLEATLARKTFELAKAAGLVGGVAVVHAYRCELKDGPDRYHVGQLQISPHVHLLAWGRADDSADIHAKTGWVVVNLTYRREVKTGRRVDLDEDGIASVVAYLLDHCALLPRRQAYKYWGVAGNNQVLVVEKGRRVEDVVCECGAPAWEFGVDDHGLVDWTDVRGPARQRVEWRRYALRERPSSGSSPRPR